MVFDEQTGLDDGLRTSQPPAAFRPVIRWTLDSLEHVATMRRELLEAITTPGRPAGRSLQDVPDHDLSSTPHVAGDRPLGHGGFGLQIARRLAQDVGWYATTHTKHVWATFPAP